MSTIHRSADEYGLSLILGGAEGKLWDITGIYAGLARCVNCYFKSSKVDLPVFFAPEYNFMAKTKETACNDAENQNKKILYSDSPLDPATCWLTLQAMLDVVRPNEERAWRSFASSRKIAWKTGTSNGFRDGWAIGITPKYAVGVWTGNADGEGRPELTGISTAAPILFELFDILDAGTWFGRPEFDLNEIEVCALSGHRAGPNCGQKKKEFITEAGLNTKMCPYCRIVHCDSTLNFRVDSKTERITAIRSEKWFVLPPAIEWYYKNGHSDYKMLPPLKNISQVGSTLSMSFIYPNAGNEVYVPVEIDGNRGRVVFKAAHRISGMTIFWHLDNHFLGTTTDIHQMGLAPNPGKHTITLVDENGNRLQQIITILEKN